MTSETRARATDTIAAVATGAGRAGIGVIRVSGPAVPDIARAVTGRDLAPRLATRCVFRDADGEPLDDGVAIRFAAPASFTGEDVLELQGHGGAVVLDLVLARTLALGARVARPGEFSERAFLNGRLDLAQAEAIADLVESTSAAAARAAVRSLEGEFSAEVDAVVEETIALRIWLEAALDFSEEDIDFLAEPALVRRADALVARLDALLAKSEQGRRLRDGLTVVIAGRPNVGKSSLLNALAGAERAIVTDVAGTTRDVLREDVLIDGMPLHVVDTAGLRATDDVVEREGVARARRAAEGADHVLVVVDATDPAPPALEELPADVPRTLVVNKVDLVENGETARERARARWLEREAPTRSSERAEDDEADRPSGTFDDVATESATARASSDAATDSTRSPGGFATARPPTDTAATESGGEREDDGFVVSDVTDAVPDTDDPSVVLLSAKRGEGLDALRAHLLAVAGRDESVEGVFLARRRHVAALEEARGALDDALTRLREGVMPELAAEELRLAQRALDTIVGRFDAEDLLGRIFSEFCIGK